MWKWKQQWQWQQPGQGRVGRSAAAAVAAVAAVAVGPEPAPPLAHASPHAAGQLARVSADVARARQRALLSGMLLLERGAVGQWQQHPATGTGHVS